MSKRQKIRPRGHCPPATVWAQAANATPLAELVGIRALAQQYGTPLDEWVHAHNERRFHALYAPWLLAQQDEGLDTLSQLC